MKLQKSSQAFREAKKYIPGGVNSPVRSFKGVGGTPPYIARGKGSKVWDIDGNEYIDYVGSWGPMILGHSHPEIIAALQDKMTMGTSFGAPTLLETEMAKLITEMVPSIEMVRMVNSGTEATMSALRLARGYTGRQKIIKFEGCYHGHADSFLIKAGSGALTLGVPNSPGVTDNVAKDTLTASFNDLDSVQILFERYSASIAAVILEPIPGNMGVILPDREFITGLREMCSYHGALLIFDEVMTGFRVARGGAQELLGVNPDLTTLGKIIGGGLPVGAYGGKREIMECVAPLGPVYQAGTLSGNPLAMTAGMATLRVINADDTFYDKLEKKSARLELGIQGIIDQFNEKALLNRVGSMFTLFFPAHKYVKTYADVSACRIDTFNQFFNYSLEAGIYLAPSQYEAGFISSAHSDEDIQRTIEKCAVTFDQLKNKAPN